MGEEKAKLMVSAEQERVKMILEMSNQKASELQKGGDLEDVVGVRLIRDKSDPLVASCCSNIYICSKNGSYTPPNV